MTVVNTSLAANGVVLTDAGDNPYSITSLGAIVGATAPGVQSGAAVNWTIGNAGTVQSTATSGSSQGILLTAGTPTITNNAGALIAGYVAGISVTGTGTVVNQGSIVSSQTAGAGYAFVSGQLTPFNAGIILGAGSVTNATAAVISAYLEGVAVGGGGSVSNAGTINASSTAIGFGVVLPNGGGVGNASTGRITGGWYGILALGTPATVTNSGTISGSGNLGVALIGGGGVSNAAGGTISGGKYGVFANAVSTTTIANAGSIGATSIAGVVLLGAGVVTNQSGGRVTGSFAGVYTKGAPVTNAAGGTISGFTFGIDVVGAVSTVVNAGSIASARTGGGAAVQLATGGVVTNSVGGSISAQWIGVQIGASTITSNAGSVNNSGRIFASDGTNGAAVWIHGPASIYNAPTGQILGGPYAIVAYYATTLVNKGTVAGTQFAFDPVNKGFANRVVAFPGAVFSGVVSGGNSLGSTVSSTLELASAAATGTIGGIGSQFIEMANVTIDAGASWVMTGTNTIASAQTLITSGTLTNAGTLLGSAIVGSGGAFVNGAGALATGNTALLMTSAAGTITNSGTVQGTAATGLGAYLAAGGTVTNLSGGTIDGFNGIQINSAAGVVTNNGLLTGSTSAGAGAYLRAGGSLENQSLGTISGHYGIVLAHGAGTVSNAGQIAGAGAAALSFAGGFENRLILKPGGGFSGTVDGGNPAGGSIVSTLQLGAGGTGTFAGLGGQFIGFGAIEVDAAANWTLQGTNNIDSFIDRGTGTIGSGAVLTVSKSVTVDGSADAAARVVMAGASWTGASAMVVGGQSKGELTVAGGGTVSAASLTIGAQSSGAGTVDLGAGGQILLTGSIAIGGQGKAELIIGSGAAVHATGGFFVGTGGTVTSNGGVLDPPVVSQNFGVIGGTGMLVGDVENNGTIFAKNGTYELTGNVTTGAGQSGLLLVNGSTANLMLDGAVDSGETIAFSGVGGTLTIGNLAGFNPAAINGFAAGDHLVLSGITLASQAFDSATDKLTLTDNLNNHYTLQFADGLTAASFTGAIVPAGTVTAGQWATDIAGNFADASRWTGGAVPGATTDAVINFASRPQVLHSGGADTVKSLTNTAGSFVMSGGTLTAGTLTNASTMRWTGGALALTTNGTLANSGTLTIGANGQRLSGTNAELTNTGGIVVGGGLGTAEIDVAFVNTGSVVLNTGTLGLNGGGSSNASLLQGSAGGVLQFGTQAGGGGATFTLTGGFYAARNTVVNGSTLDVSAASGGVVFVDSLAINAGRLATGAQNATAQGAMTQTGGTIGGTATLSAAGGAFLSGGLQTGAGETALFNASGIGGAIQLDGGRSLRNNGRLDWSAGAIALGAGDGGAVTHAASLTNAASGLLYITANARLTSVGASTMTNAGLMVAQAGSGQVDIDAPLINSGNLQLPSGTLSLNGGGSSAGDHIFTDGAATLRFGATQGSATGGSFAISGGLYAAANTVVDGGTLDVSGASGAVFPSLLKLASGRLALGALSIVDQNQLTQTGGVLAGTGTLTVFGGAGLTGGVQTGAGVTRLLNTSVIGSGFQVDGGRTIRNDSLMNWSSGTIDLGAGDGGALTHAATLATTASGVFYVTAAGGRIASHGAGVVSNAGVMALNAGAGRVDIDAAFLNSGVVQVQSGTLSINGGGTMTGQMFAGAQAIVQFGTVAGGGAGGAFAVSGVSYGVGRTVVNGATLDVSGASGAGFGTSLSIGAGLLQLGALNASSGVLSLSGSGVLTGSGFFFVGGNAVLSGGLQTGSGVTVLTAPTTIVGSTSVDGGRTVVNTSSLVWNGGSIGLGSGDGGVGAHAGTLNNNSGAVFEIQTDGGLSGAGTINNGGTIVKSGGLGTTTLNAAVNNGGGTIVATAGTLSLAQGATGAGTFILDGAATLDFVSGVGGGSTMQFLHAGGTLATHADGLFGATISGFGAGDVIDAAGVVFGVGNTLGFNAGTLTVGDGTHSAGFALVGTYSVGGFHMGSDGHGGVAITYA